MHDLEVLPSTPAPARRRRRWLRWVLAALVAVVAVGGYLVWNAFRPPKAVSVSAVVDKFRNREQPSGSPSHVAGGPLVGVYVYATKGSERVSAGGVTHHYPARTTLTVTGDACGLRLRWDALSGRWAEWQVCSTPQGWRLEHYVDVHTFLYMKDVHDYTCTTTPAATAGADWSVACRTGSGLLTSTVHTVGVDNRRVDGAMVRATHVRITQHATGKSLSDGTIDAWVLPSGLPARVDIRDHGSQVVLGQDVTYDESASFELTSPIPRR